MSQENLNTNIENENKATKIQEYPVQLGLFRQKYHFMPKTGWMNDPNGLVFFKGKYHCFYQHNPYSPCWDTMYWGHAISDDMIHWEYLPIALAPSKSYDNSPRGGCFSGSAIVYNEVLYILYTSVIDNGSFSIQTQSLAYSKDGISFTKYKNNPVVSAPFDVENNNFRDPKVWRNGESFYFVCGASSYGIGEILLYKSSNLFDWELFCTLFKHENWGKMWECPDFFEIGNKFVLTGSPVCADNHKAVYIMGDFDYCNGVFIPTSFEEIDFGNDYYAPQSFMTPDGRRVIFAWSNEWEWMPDFKDWGPTFQEGWCGMFTIPREIKIHSNGKLQFIPIKELECLRNSGYHISQFRVDSIRKPLIAGNGISFEMKFSINLLETDAGRIDIILRSGGGKEVICIADIVNEKLIIDRTNADNWNARISESPLICSEKEYLDFHIFSDQCSLEVFSDNYQYNQTNNIFPSVYQNELYIQAYNGTALIQNYESYGLSVRDKTDNTID